MKITVYFVRHGESVRNAHQDIDSAKPKGGDCLTGKGWQQARTLGKRLAGEGLTHIISSPMRRAQETTGAVNEALQLPVETHPDIYEVRQPQKTAELSLRESIQHYSPFWMAKHNDDPDYALEEGESFNQVVARVQKFQHYLVDRAAEKKFLVVAHGDFLRFFLGYSVLREDFQPKHFLDLWNLKAANTGVTIFEYSDSLWEASRRQKGWRLLTWMDQSHL